MFNVNHFHEEHADIAKEVMSKIYTTPTYSDLEIAVIMAMVSDKMLEDYKNG